MNKRGHIELSVVPCRRAPKHNSELVNQLLFGESFTVLDENDEWFFIRCDYDDYECWIDKKQAELSDKIENNYIRQSSQLHTLCNNNNIIKTLRGSVFHNYNNAQLINNYEKEWNILEDNEYIIEETSIKKAALSYLNTPYIWGGKSPFGIDCSGFTQMVFALNNIKLKRDAYQQAEQGSVVSLKDAKEGDLAFFSNKNGKISHVGIVLDDNKVIHCSGKVRIDKLDEKGILNVETNSYSHQFAGIRRVYI